jgi:osmotically-inducible protein OsmY
MRNIITALLMLALLLSSCDIMASSKLEGAVVKALHADSRTKEFTFEVSHEGEGRVLITGEVDTPAQIDAAKEVAAAVEGVTSVSARIEVADNSSSSLMQDGGFL